LAGFFTIFRNLLAGIWGSFLRFIETGFRNWLAACREPALTQKVSLQLKPSCVFISGGIAAGQVARHLLIQPNQAHHASREQLYTPDKSIQINASTQNQSINHSIQIRMDSPGRRSACSQGTTGPTSDAAVRPASNAGGDAHVTS